jgi:hypothetical protein
VRFAFLAAALLLVSTAEADPLPAAGPMPLLSHRAEYQMDLARPTRGGGLATLSGRMVLEWASSCDGYTTNQRLVTRSTDDLGQDTLNDFVASSWESRDGRTMRFAARQKLNRDTVGEYVGSAELGGNGAEGNAAFTKPDGQTVTLPQGTVFPTAEIQHILAAARGGRRQASDIVFDGSGETALYQADAYIVPVAQGQRPVPDAAAKVLGGMRSWMVEVSYFPYASHGGAPEYELSFRLFENGVSTDLLLDYGDMAIKGRLIGFQPLPGAGC